jgi:hypothetical protein
LLLLLLHRSVGSMLSPVVLDHPAPKTPEEVAILLHLRLFSFAGIFSKKHMRGAGYLLPRGHIESDK